LREIRALQINVEARFLDVSTDWFEQIGVDLDLYFNTNNTMFQNARGVDPTFQLSDFFGTDGQLKNPLIFDSPSQANFPDDNGTGGFANTVAWGAAFGLPDGDPATATDITYITNAVGQPIRNTQGFSPIGIIQDSLGILDAEGVATLTGFGNAITAVNPAVALGVQFLDDIQVDLLIEATQADRRSVVLTAPRLTFFNGQRAWVAVTTSRAFVSGLTAVTGDSSGAFQPQLALLREGFVLDVEGVISADRRYVTMTVLASLAQAGSLEETAQFQGAAGGGGVGGGGAQSFSGEIQLPSIDLSLVQTTVSVPDRGTIMLGGQRRVNEFEVEVGVPVLSKIPWLNRFFTNRINNKEEQTLLVLIRPEIIIQQENEDILFPGLSDQLGGASSYLR
jgi:type II secretory pathway component GspD/PulD (secretin)